VDRRQTERKLIKIALKEDIGSGDITTQALKLRNKLGKAVVIAKGEGIISGLGPFKMTFNQLSTRIALSCGKRDGARVVPGDTVLSISGPLQAILTGERTAMNILCHLSGVATMAGQLIEEVKDLRVKILDTRKTTPGMRLWEKLAVRHGGATNHRLGLFDMYLVKENHIWAAGGLDQALRKVSSHKRRTLARLEVEVRNLDELRKALAYDVDYVLLDNFSLQELKKAVAITRKICSRTIIEASGNVNLANVRRIALTGVDRISVGKMTHSAPALDLSMKVVPAN
jgi:nicotinate-nucleotide pyrophosphorylase (carboxylating)